MAAAGITFGTADSAQAAGQTLYSTSFEQPIFSPGTKLLGTDGWSTNIPPFLNPDAATITAATASDGAQSVQVLGADLIGSGGITAPYDAVGSYRRPINYTVTPAKFTAIVEADLLLETTQATTPGEFFSLTIAAISGNGRSVGEIGLSSEGIVEAFKFDTQPGSAPTFSESISFNQWHHVTMLLDYAKGRTTYLVDGRFLGTVPASGASKGLARASMVVYARPDGDTSGGAASARANYTARFDNFHVTVSDD